MWQCPCWVSTCIWNFQFISSMRTSSELYIVCPYLNRTFHSMNDFFFSLIASSRCSHSLMNIWMQSLCFSWSFIDMVVAAVFYSWYLISSSYSTASVNNSCLAIPLISMCLRNLSKTSLDTYRLFMSLISFKSSSQSIIAAATLIDFWIKLNQQSLKSTAYFPRSCNPWIFLRASLMFRKAPSLVICSCSMQ